MATVEPGSLLNELVDTHWSTAARHAWRQYQHQGRGAIVFPIEPNADESERTPLRYLTFTDESAAQEGTFSMLYKLIREYDPEHQVVAAAVLPDERTVFDVYERKPSPPEA